MSTDVESALNVPNLLGYPFHHWLLPPHVLRFMGKINVPKEGLLGTEVKRADPGARQLGLKSWPHPLLVI